MASPENTIRVVVLGGSGYAGLEVLRWLRRHPVAETVGIFGPPEETGPIDEFFPLLSGHVKLTQEAFSLDAVAGLEADLAMLCVPHKVAMSYVPGLRTLGLRIIDWSADYRFNDKATYESWYCKHTDGERLKEAVYGLPEFHADKIAVASVVANPGCYPACAAIALVPAIRAGLISPSGIVVNAVSGVSGAGRKPGINNHFPERNENFEPYSAGGHRHQPEMEQVISDVSGRDVKIFFQPHLCPMDRGMLCSIYSDPEPETTLEKLFKAFDDAYGSAPFVRVRRDVLPATKYVSTTNFCDVSVAFEGSKVKFFSAIDNLLKGASTQAIQNMNIMFGLDETTGLY